MFEEIINDLQMRLSPKRFAHTLGVARAAVGLAQRYVPIRKKRTLPGFCMIVLKNCLYRKCSVW